MPIISLANPKGGSGKSTAALIIGLEFSSEAKVAIIDADPNAVIQRWAQRRTKKGLELPLTITARPEEGEMINTLAELNGSHDFVLIDLEGTASRLLSRAIGRSNLVIIPLNPSPIDAELAAASVRLVKEEIQAYGRDIPHCMLWSRYPAAVKTKSIKRIHDAIVKSGNKILTNGLVERAAYRDIFETGNTIDELVEQARGDATKKDMTNSDRAKSQQALERITKAKDNAFALAQEIASELQTIMEKSK